MIGSAHLPTGLHSETSCFRGSGSKFIWLEVSGLGLMVWAIRVIVGFQTCGVRPMQWEVLSWNSPPGLEKGIL